MVVFAELLNRKCNLLRRIGTGVYDEYGVEIENWTVIQSNIPCRREGSKATDNVPLNIGDGEQLRSQQLFFFEGDVPIRWFDRLDLLEMAVGPRPEDGLWEVLNVDSLEMFGEVTHHLEVEAHRIFD